MMKLTSFLSNSSKLALKTNKRQYTHHVLRIFVMKTIQYLQKHNVKSKNRIVLISDHDDLSLLLIAAASAIGLEVVVPYNLNSANIKEWVSIIEDMKPNYIIYSKNEGESLRLLSSWYANVIPFDFNCLEHQGINLINDYFTCKDSINNFLVLYTSGTTGKPKAMSISEEQICQQISNVSGKLKFSNDSTVLMSGLMNNTTGIIFTFGALRHQSTLVYPCSRNVSEWPAQIEQEKVTHIMLRPASLERFLSMVKQKNHSLPSLKILAYGAAILSQKVLEQGRHLLNCEWIQGYGLSETFGPFCWLTEQDHKNGIHKKFSYCIGKPDTKLEIKIENEKYNDSSRGELLLRGEGLMQGYYDVKKNKLIPVSEWFHTGDCVELSEEGYIVLKGRMNTTVLTKNGHRVNPQEIEGVMKEASFVRDVVLVDDADIATDNKNGAVLCLCPKNLTNKYRVLASVLNELVNNFSREKWPDCVCIHDQLFPRGGNDKILRKKVGDIIQQKNIIKIKKEDIDHVTHPI
ncbi:MAG: fatty acid--CoA ligase family protein [Gammaproteobacteria bacterium]|nr:fatty acid--CoA ligase family protein [Gammaproteobacteria bacterium]